MTDSKPQNIIQIAHSEILIREDGITQVTSSDHEYTAEDLQALHQTIWQMNHQKKACILAIASRFTQVTDDARKYLATEEGSKHSLASAFVIHSLSQRILVNFLIKVQGRPAPTRFFTDMETAIEWLKKMKKESEIPLL